MLCLSLLEWIDRNNMADIIEDIFAFLTVTGDGKKADSNNVSSICSVCGSVLEYDEDSEEMSCPDCDS
jgi:hypothetical protein